MNTLQNEMQRYLQVIERAEADPEVWGKLTEGTGIATANGYRAALKAAAQPVAPEQAPYEACRQVLQRLIDLMQSKADVIYNYEGMTDSWAQWADNVNHVSETLELLEGFRHELPEAPQPEAASQQVKGYTNEEVLAAAEAIRCNQKDAAMNPNYAVEFLTSLSAKGEAAHPSFDVIDKYGATHLIEKVPGTEVELSHLRHDQSVVSGDNKTFHYRLTKVDVDKGEAPKEKYGAVVRAEDGAPYDALAELIKRGIKLARLRADIKSDVEDAFYSQTVAIEIDGVRTTAVTHERFNRMLNVLYDRWLPRSTPAAPEGTVSAPVDLRAVLLAYEQWEADVIADNACWGAEGMSPYPILCDGHWDRFIEIQSMRNEALGTWSKVAPVTNSVDSSLSVKDANQNAVEASEGGEGICDRCGGNGFVGDGLERCPKCEMPDAEEGQAAAHSGVVEVLRRVLPILEKHSLWAFQLASDALAAPKEGERPEPFTDHDLLQMANAWAEGTPYPTPDRTSFVAGVKAILKAKPNPEAFVAALRAVRSELEREAMGLTYEGAGDYDNGVRRGLLSAVDQLDPILTQWEASQPSPDSPKN